MISRSDYRSNGPRRNGESRIGCTADWVHWYTTSWLMHHLGRIPPVEAETNYHADISAGRPAWHT